jgi:hypothetical protein
MVQNPTESIGISSSVIESKQSGNLVRKVDSCLERSQITNSLSVLSVGRARVRS